MERKWKVLAITGVAVFMGFLGVTIVNVAFTDLERDFADSSLADLSWVLNAYKTLMAAAAVATGLIGVALGRVRAHAPGEAAVPARPSAPQLQEAA